MSVENELRNFFLQELSSNWLISQLQSRITLLEEKLSTMENRCVCVKVNKPFEENVKQ